MLFASNWDQREYIIMHIDKLSGIPQNCMELLNNFISLWQKRHHVVICSFLSKKYSLKKPKVTNMLENVFLFYKGNKVLERNISL